MVATALDKAGSGEPLIRIDGLSVGFGRHGVLRDLSLDIPRGQTLAVIGESGCGKTVLLKVIIGLLRPARGAVYFDGRDLAALNPRALARLRTRFGFVFQQAALFDSMTVAQNVAFPLRQHTTRKSEEIRRIVVSRLAEVGLPETVMARKPAELSGGMRKRVGLARALSLEPEAILYDEPTTGLDPVLADHINDLVLRTRDQLHVTSLAVTHDMTSAYKIADRIAMLHEGRIHAVGTPKEIQATTDPIVRQFITGTAEIQTEVQRGTETVS